MCAKTSSGKRRRRLLSNNPFFNFLRVYRQQCANYGWKSSKVVMEGAKVWRSMDDVKRRRYAHPQSKSECPSPEVPMSPPPPQLKQQRKNVRQKKQQPLSPVASTSEGGCLSSGNATETIKKKTVKPSRARVARKAAKQLLGKVTKSKVRKSRKAAKAAK